MQKFQNHRLKHYKSFSYDMRNCCNANFLYCWRHQSQTSIRSSLAAWAQMKNDQRPQFLIRRFPAL
jgi:hypothetical protein